MSFYGESVVILLLPISLDIMIRLSEAKSHFIHALVCLPALSVSLLSDHCIVFPPHPPCQFSILPLGKSHLFPHSTVSIGWLYLTMSLLKHRAAVA